mgnify:CR=1 FL=1
MRVSATHIPPSAILEIDTFFYKSIETGLVTFPNNVYSVSHVTITGSHSALMPLVMSRVTVNLSRYSESMSFNARKLAIQNSDRGGRNASYECSVMVIFDS